MRRPPPTAALLAAALLLQACNTTETLDPQGAGANPPAGQTPAAPAPATQTEIAIAPVPQTPGTLDGQAAAINALARVHFAPVVGATVEAATPLARRLSESARTKGIGVVGSGDPATTHVIKGYFSALSEGRETIVIYVWDVLDPSGNRLHRIQGQEKAPGGGGDAWSAVPSSAMEAIADRTIGEFQTWLASKPG